MNKEKHCGYVAIIGRPNVGKSTLLNQLVGEKVSITSSKPQTTRHRILGIKTDENNQIIFVDTPGLHPDPKHEINKLMIKAAYSAIKDVDVIIFVIDARKWTAMDNYILQQIAQRDIPVVLALNKIDKIKDKKTLLPFMESLHEKLQEHKLHDAQLIPLAAIKGKGISELLHIIEKDLPESDFYFPADQITDRSERFLTAEIIREKLMRVLGQEVPHAIAVEIEKFKLEKDILHIHAIIWVERKGQKLIVIGQKGEGLKLIGKQARLELETLFKQKVFLQLWVKVKAKWTDDLRALHSLGYDEQN